MFRLFAAILFTVELLLFFSKLLYELFLVMISFDFIVPNIVCILLYYLPTKCFLSYLFGQFI